MNRKNKFCSVLQRMQRLMFLLAVTLCSTIAFAQSKITGTVVDEMGEPVIGASVMVKGTTTGGVTDLDGNFTIANVKQGAQLVVSYVGYATQTVQAKNNVKVVLQEDKQLLDELVVVGYGTQRKSDVTGALSHVGSQELERRPVSNAFEALQGKAAGVDITTSERPGTVGDIRIRGERSRQIISRLPRDFRHSQSLSTALSAGLAVTKARATMP